MSTPVLFFKWLISSCAIDRMHLKSPLDTRCIFYNADLIKSNQIKSLLLSHQPQHKCLGEWNSYERAPDSAKKKQKKNTSNLHMDRQCKKNNKQFTYGQTVQKKTTSNLHMDRQCKKTKQKKPALEHLQCSRQCKKKQQQQFTYGQYIFTDCTEDNVQNTHTYTQYT